MRNRDFVIRKLENLEGTLSTLEHLVKTQQPIQQYQVNLDKAKDLVEEIKSFIEVEPLS